MLDDTVLDTVEDDDDAWEDDDFLGDDEWEDENAFQEIIDKLPDGWHLIKVFNYTAQRLEDMQEWCVDNCRGAWEKVRWSAGCSYSTGVKFENFIDATYFKLHWS